MEPIVHKIITSNPRASLSPRTSIRYQKSFLGNLSHPAKLLMVLGVLLIASTYVKANTVTAVATGSWSAGATWNRTATGTFSTGSPKKNITGVGTNFSADCSAGEIFYDNTGASLGTIASVTSATVLTLAGNPGSTYSNATFSVGKAPQANDNVVLSGAFNVTVDASTNAIGSLTMSNGTLSFGGAFNLSIGGNFAYTSGTFTKGTGTVTYNGATAQTVAALNYNNLTFSGAGQKNAAGTITVGATLTNGSVLDMAGNTLTLGTSTANTGGTVRFSGATNGKLIGTGTVEYYGSTAQTIASGTYAALKVSNTTGASVTALTTVDALTIDASAIMNVNATKALTVNTTLTNNGILNLQSDATGTATIKTPVTLSGTGTYNVKQYLTGSGGATANGRFWYLSSPLDGVSATGFGVNQTSSKLWKYNETTHGYATVSNSDVMEKGRGYVARLGANSTITHGAANVKLNTGTQTVSISRTETDSKKGYNLVGNPYAAYVTLDIADNPGIETSMWYRSMNSGGTGMVYDTWNLATGLGVVSSGSGDLTSDIAPMQAFWVRATAPGTTNVTFKQINTTHQPSTVKLRSAAVASAQKVRISVSNGVYSDQTLIGFFENAQDSYDTYDSYKMSNENVAVPEIFTYVGTDEVAINGMAPLESSRELAIGFRTGTAGTFTFNASEISNMEEGTKVLLKDKLLNLTQDLTLSPSYTFTSDVTTTNSRFSLVITKVATVINMVAEEPAFNAFAENNGRINVQLSNIDANGTQIKLYSVSGKLLLSKPVDGAITTFDSKLPYGIYLIEVSRQGYVGMNKIVIN